MNSWLNFLAIISLTAICYFPSPAHASEEPVRCVQEQLNRMGFPTGIADGLMGKKTKSASISYIAAKKKSLELPELSSKTARHWCKELASTYPELAELWTALKLAEIPTYDRWPSGTKAGSRGMVRNENDLDHAFSRVSSPHPVRYGKMSERYELRHGDCGGQDCHAPRSRSELREQDSNILARFDHDTWFGWSFYNQSIEEIDPAVNIVTGQWKASSDHMLAGIKELRGNVYPFQSCAHWGICGSAAGNHRDNSFLELNDMRVANDWSRDEVWGSICQVFHLADIKGRWIDIVVNTNFSTRDDGYFKIWVDDELVCDYRGQIAEKDLIAFRGPSHRRGIYWSATQEWDAQKAEEKIPTMVAYYDEFRMGQYREQVDIRMIEAIGGPAVD